MKMRMMQLGNNQYKFQFRVTIINGAELIQHSVSNLSISYHSVISYMLPENPLESGTQWKCDRCPHRIESSRVREIVSSFIGRKHN